MQGLNQAAKMDYVRYNAHTVASWATGVILYGITSCTGGVFDSFGIQNFCTRHDTRTVFSEQTVTYCIPFVGLEKLPTTSLYKLPILIQLYFRMPPANSNTPSVDARYVQNLTINIMYNTGMSKAVHLHLSSFIHHFFGTMLPGPGTNNGPHPQ